MGVYHRDSYGTICLPGQMERFEQREKKRNGEDGQAFPFFDGGLCAFGAQAECMQYAIFPMLQVSIFEPFHTALGHFKLFWIIN